MSWNIRTGVGNDPLREGISTPWDLQRIARVIGAIRPDVVALQEVDRYRDRTGGVDQPSLLSELTGMDAAFAANLVDQAGEYGVTILSRHPVPLVEHIRFPEVPGWEPRGLLDVVIRAGERDVRVINTHLQVGGADASSQRADSAEAIALRARSSKLPIILTGDFNADPASDELSSLRFLTDAWSEKGDGAGYTIPATPFGVPRARIDAIFVDRGFLVRDCGVIRSSETMLASDHYPVVADLVLTP